MPRSTGVGEGVPVHREGVGGKALRDPEGEGEARRAGLAEVGWEELRTPGFFSTGREWVGDGEQSGEVSTVTHNHTH